MNSHLKNNRHGFTILEVLIATFILTLISLGIYRAVTGSFRVRATLQKHGNFYNEVQISLGILKKDIMSMYSPLLMLPPEPEKPKNQPNIPTRENQVRIDPNDISDYWGAMVNQSGIRPSRFIGEADSLSFITSSHVRVYQDSPESVFSKVKYELKEDSFATDEFKGTQVLVKSENSSVFDMEENEKFVRQYPLLHGIVSVKFKYYNREKERWENRWDTASRDFKDTYPDAIQLEIQIKRKDDGNFEGTYTFRPEIPLNGLEATI